MLVSPTSCTVRISLGNCTTSMTQRTLTCNTPSVRKAMQPPLVADASTTRYKYEAVLLKGDLQMFNYLQQIPHPPIAYQHRFSWLFIDLIVGTSLTAATWKLRAGTTLRDNIASYDTFKTTVFQCLIQPCQAHSQSPWPHTRTRIKTGGSSYW